MKEGVYKISSEAYHRDPCDTPSLSRGIIMDLLFKSPAHARISHPRLNPNHKEEPDSKYSKGTAAHCLFLEGIDNTVVVHADDWRKKEAKELRDRAWAEGKTPLLEHQFEEVCQMVKAADKALNESELAGIFDDGDAEMTYIWQEGPVWCRSLLDKISKDREIILDYKTTGTSANPEDFIRNILNHGYDIQASFYSRGVSSVLQDGTIPKFVFLVQEDSEPYLCSLIALSPAFMEMANQKVIRGIDLWRTCMATGEWPGYGNRIAWVEPPPWALTWEMRANFLGSTLEDL